MCSVGNFLKWQSWLIRWRFCLTQRIRSRLWKFAKAMRKRLSASKIRSRKWKMPKLNGQINCSHWSLTIRKVVLLKIWRLLSPTIISIWLWGSSNCVVWKPWKRCLVLMNAIKSSGNCVSELLRNMHNAAISWHSMPISIYFCVGKMYRHLPVK